MTQQRAKRLILLEFNELSPDLMDRFIGMGYLPNFRRLRDESQVLVTEASERGWELNPWVQWVTVHSGLDYREHQIIELDEGTKLSKPRVWDIVSQANKPVWLCGSMNIGYQQPLNGLVLPDPWTTKVQPSPVLRPFFEFVQRNVLEHSTNRPDLRTGDYIAFVKFMVTHGLSLTTVYAIARQLIAERFKPGIRWKRAVLLDKLQFDVFRWFYRRLRPAFSTFFCNSTAHFQHYHWREMEPHLFAAKPDPARQAAHEKTILFGYQQMDLLVGRFLRLLDQDTVLVFSTAISQQPCLVYEEQGGKVMYRPHEFSKLMAFAGVTDQHRAAPLMAEVFNLEFNSEPDAARAERVLLGLEVDGRPALQVQRKGALLNVKCCVHVRKDEHTAVLNKGTGARARFLDLFFELEEEKSGMHHPDGILWIRLPGRVPRRYAEKVPLSSVAPTLLRLLGLAVPEHMKAPIGGLCPVEGSHRGVVTAVAEA